VRLQLGAQCQPQVSGHPLLQYKERIVQYVNKIFIGMALASMIVRAAKAQDDWIAIGHDRGEQRYSSLKQIDRKNVAQLRLAWTYDTGLKGATFEATPLVVKGVLYVTTPKDELVALDATTGKQLWKYDTGETSVRTSRGVSYWPGDQRNPPRIVMGTASGLMIELDAETGAPVDGFGDHGRINIVEPSTDPSVRSGFGETSPPAIYKNIAIMAPGTQEGPSHGVTGNGDPRAFDILTGKQLWRFHSMPREGEFGSDTWGAPDGWKDRSGPSAWVPISVDQERGIAYIATGNPADSYYGADRKGTNLYANCILALDATTGKLLWYYQMVHHDLWDGDASGTALIDVHRNGKTIPAIAGLTKSGLMFILDRTTGKPIFGVEERPVPQSDVPGEATFATQPFPLKPPPLARQSMTTADLTTMTPTSQQACAAKWATAHNDGPYTPYGLTPTVTFPSAVGASNWGGASYDPKLGYVFANTSNFGAISEMVPASAGGSRGNRGSGRGDSGQPQADGGLGRGNGARGEQNVGGPPPDGAPGRGFGPRPNAGPPMPYRNAGATTRFVGPDGFPCQKPPWGLLTAVNANTGNIAWQVPLGNYDDLAAADTSLSSSVTPAALPDGTGKTETITACSNCHMIATVTSMRLSKDAWTDVVNTMVSRGLQVSSADKTTIINYLAANLAPASNGSASPPTGATQAPARPAPANAPETGTPNIGATMVTAGGLVFFGGTLDNTFRAFDAQTGKELWSAKLDGVGYSGPITYMGSNGKQIVVIDIGGPGNLRSIHNHASDSPNEIVAFELP
jgi:glucose dehydrogenase